jgi:hypothetical protein
MIPEDPMLRAAYTLLATLALSASWLAAAAPGGAGASWCGTSRDGARGAIAAHREQESRRGLRARSARSTSVDVGEIAVLQDEGELALLARLFDLQGVTLRFAPVEAAGFAVTQVAAPLFEEAGSPLALGDDDDEPVALPFRFPFYGTAYRTVFVSSDGNVTFGAADGETGSRDLARLVEGPPRIAPLLADLDPSRGGTVAWSTAGDRFTVTWTAVPQFGQNDRNTFQVNLYADGRVEMAYGSQVSSSIELGAIGLAPGGGATGFTPIDFRSAAGQQGVSLGQSLRALDAIDLVAVARKFYVDHRDDFDQLVVFTNRRLVPSGAFAYEQTVRNQVEGTGDDVFDVSASYGSAGRLESVITMDAIAKYPAEPAQVFLGADSSLGVLAHEVGHRWLARATFRDGERASAELLGRQNAHWSFFADTDGSHVEGNDIEDLGGGRFRTVAAGVRYGPLDQYLMGLRDAAEVPPFFFVRDPADTFVDPARDPEAGVTFTGTRKDVTIADVVAALGPRRPATAAAPRGFRQAFVFVAVGEAPAATDIEKVERIRVAWEPYFARSTEGRGSVDARLR